jgi:signal transduction histidine kinase
VLEEIRRTSRMALEDMRKALGLLRLTDHPDAELDRVSLSYLGEMIAECRAAGVEVNVERSGDPLVLSPILDQTAYRIVQEALTNVLKHAGAGATATVRLSVDDAGIDLEVTDDGPGSPGPIALGSQRGLIGMRERVEVFGGSFTAGPMEGRGFRVFARLPLGRSQERLAGAR